MKSTQVTIKDIAEIAGVSFSTVSRSLNGSSQVSEKTRKKICQIADDLGFEFNAGARSMITSRAGTVGIILPEQYTQVNVNVYHGMLMNSLRTYLEKADVDLIVSYQENHYSKQNNIRRLISRKKVDGFILLVEQLSSETLEILNSRDFPFVCTHFPPEAEVKDQDVIFSDNYVGGQLVAEHLLEQGKTSFLLLAMEERHTEFELRERGFTETVEKAGYKVCRISSNSTYDDARLKMRENIAEARGSDALFAINDLMALGAMRTLKEEGFNMPGDIAIVGYDDIEFGRYSHPALTSIHQPREELAHISCDRLFMQMEKNKLEEGYLKKRISIQPVLIKRESS
ncbi:MAG: LacI family transcriptional regulator [Spirochaetaceae bacterium 4572_59]|nr:MAG: LacI family transcriptional regulator [Spirochaetaceae bacterium 4572_59]